MLYMVTFTINIPQMLAYIPYIDPMGYGDRVGISYPNMGFPAIAFTTSHTFSPRDASSAGDHPGVQLCLCHIYRANFSYDVYIYVHIYIYNHIYIYTLCMLCCCIQHI